VYEKLLDLFGDASPLHSAMRPQFNFVRVCR
jgi:hypothetical protein